LSTERSIVKRSPVVRWVLRRRTELQFGTRVTVAGLAAFVLAELIALPQSYWAVFTAVLVTQASVGGSLTAARDRLIGTLGGAAYSAVVAVLIPHTEPVGIALALLAALGPLAVLAALNPVFRVAPVTGVIILLGTAGVQEGPILAAFLRTLEVAFGGFVGLAVSVLVLPKRGSAVMFETADRITGHLATLFGDLISGLIAQLDPRKISRQHDTIQSSFDKLEAAGAEAERERRTFLLSTLMDLAPLPRTLRRVYHDLVLAGRVASRPLPGMDAAVAARAIKQMNAFMHALGVALARRLPPPATGGLEAALQELRLETMAPANGEAGADDASRRAALGFALEQLQRDIRDLAARAKDFALPPSG
jgi:uncharacterized membrane protein YccC